MPKLQPRQTRVRPRRVAGQTRRIGDAEETAKWLGEEFFEDALTDMEAKAALQHAGQVAAEIILDFEDGGALASYAADAKREAADAIRIFFEQVDPRDPALPVVVAQLQAQVAEFFRVCRRVRAKLDEAADAAAIINEEYGQEPTHATPEYE
jgi:hypothetical protein